MPKWLKIVLIVLGAVLVLGVAGFLVWKFILTPTKLLGSLDNSHQVSVCLGRDVYYDVYVPNEAELQETDEHAIYKYDLLTIAVSLSEPNSDYKVKVGDKWVYAESEEHWLLPTVYGFEHNKAYNVAPVYEYLTVTDPETGEEVPAVWNDGPYPYPVTGTEVHSHTTHVHGPEYLVCEEFYGRWEETRDVLLGKLCHLTGDYVPHYFDNGEIFYASSGKYAVGMRYINFNTNQTYIAKGDARNELLALIQEG